MYYVFSYNLYCSIQTYRLYNSIISPNDLLFNGVKYYFSLIIINPNNTKRKIKGNRTKNQDMLEYPSLQIR